MTAMAAGVDIGGTKIAAGLVDGRGEVRARVVLASPARRGPDAVLDAAAEAVRRAVGERPMPPVGVGAPGVIDVRTGRVRSATGILPGWTGTDVAAGLADRLATRVAVDNDVNAAALAEARFGAAREASSMVFCALGTGIGGALVAGGRLWHGATSTAGEIGHIPVPDAADLLCSCGATGHVEAVASGPSIAAAYLRLTGLSLNGPEIVRLARRGEEAALEVLARAGMALGHALTGLANALDPEVIVVGGGLVAAGPPLLDGVRSALDRGTLPGPRTVRLLTAVHGADAGVVGAALLAAEPQDQILPTVEEA
jgi:glucokinase